MWGKQTIAAVPFVASQLRQCIIKAKSAFDLGANTPAGEKRGSLISVPLSEPSHLIEYGGAKESALAAPTVDTHGYDGAWTADNVTLTPSATADSGIAYYEYSKDDGKSRTSLTGNSLTISESDFAKDYIFRAVSNAGNVSPESDPVTVQIDKAKPGVTFDGNTTDYLQEDTLKIIPIIGLSDGKQFGHRHIPVQGG